MPYINEDYSRAEALADAIADEREEAARFLRDEDPDFRWRDRLVDGLEARRCRLVREGQPVPAKLNKDIRRLDLWLDRQIDHLLHGAARR
jgi:hypothetical protein